MVIILKGSPKWPVHFRATQHLKRLNKAAPLAWGDKARDLRLSSPPGDEPTFCRNDMENEKTRPVSEIKLGAIVASIWKNEGISGSYFNVTLSRLYKEGEAWKRSESLGRDDLLLAAKVLDLSHSRIYELLNE